MGKITAEELQKVADLKSETSQLVISLGEMQYQRLSLQLVENQLIDKVKELKDKEVQFLTDLKQKYGNVSINIETGEF